MIDFCTLIYKNSFLYLYGLSRTIFSFNTGLRFYKQDDLNKRKEVLENVIKIHVTVSNSLA